MLVSSIESLKTNNYGLKEKKFFFQNSKKSNNL